MPLAVLLVALAGVVAAQPACVFSNTSVYTLTEVMACFDSIPFSPQLANDTLTVLSKAARMYPFLDIAAAPPAPFSPPVDLLAALASIRTQSFASDFAFREAVRAVFLQLHDAQ